MTGRFEGRVCLVTGSTGIAAAAAAALAEEGGKVFVASRTADHARGLAERIAGAWSAADLTQEGDVELVVNQCVEKFGRIDCVYNVAGISARRLGDGALHEMTLDGWRAALDANVTSQFLVCRATVRQMLDQEPDANGRRGTILNMGSVTAQHPGAALFRDARLRGEQGRHRIVLTLDRCLLRATRHSGQRDRPGIWWRRR